MWLPVGPSLQLALFANDAVAELSVRGLAWLWQQWEGNARASRKLARIEKQGLVGFDPHADPLARVVRLTEAGRLAALGGRDPEREWRRPWDGQWRVVLFDIPEKREALRNRLRRRLRGLHFGFLQNSAWISPDPLTPLESVLAGQKVNAETLSFLEARPGGGESDQDLVAGAWDFERIGRMYAAYLEVLRSRPTGTWRVASQREAWRRWLQREWSAWQRVVGQDPLLPAVLLPAGYRGRQIWAERMQILRELPLDLPEVRG